MKTLLIVPTPITFESVRALMIGCAMHLRDGTGIAVADTVKHVAYHYTPQASDAESGMPGVNVAVQTLETLLDTPEVRVVTADEVFNTGIKALLSKPTVPYVTPWRLPQSAVAQTCPHSHVVADVLEGDHLPTNVQWCAHCGATRIAVRP